MAKDFVLQLRYVGVFPQSGHREYRFNIEQENAASREVTLTIDDSLFQRSSLMYQEAPDLCYQKLLSHLRNEGEDGPIRNRAAVTVTDIETYRGSHPNTKPRKLGARNRT